MLWKLGNFSKRILLALISLYQYTISPLLSNKCCYYPSCSEYTRKSLERHGIIKGIILGLFRILRCNSYIKGRVDFPPDKFSFENIWKDCKIAFKKED